MSDVGRYRIVYPRLWRHPGFARLSSKSARELVLYLLTGPQTNRIGLFHFSIATAAEDLNIGAETLRERLRDVTVTFGWVFDADARVFYIPSWWRWNPPANANVLKGNLKDLNEIPLCALTEAFARNVETLHATFHPTFVECCTQRLPRRSPVQEQEQSSGSVQEQNPRRAARAAQGDEFENDALLRVARETLRLTSATETEELLDSFRFTAGAAYRDVKRSEIVKALNVAIAERRVS
jgi:hypothetical protein